MFFPNFNTIGKTFLSWETIATICSFVDLFDLWTLAFSLGQFSALDVLVRATAVGRDAEWNAERNAVLAGDPKWIILLCNTILITDIPGRGSKEERIRIHLQVWANIRNNGYKR